MKITADTNVLISATFWHGASDRILSNVESKEIELILSQDILAEYQKYWGMGRLLKKSRVKDWK